MAFVVAFIGSVALWWLYFDRGAEAGREAITHTADPGWLGLSPTPTSTCRWWRASSRPPAAMS